MARSDYGQPRAGMSGIPRGVGAPPPPGMDPKRGKLMCIKVRMLDDTVAVFHLGHKAVGQTLLDEVARHLNLLENDYFGLEFIDSMGNHCWLDKEKPILRQIAATNSDAKFYFIVKFYSPNPIDMEEEYTRYLLCMQIRRDLSLGLLHCAESTAALLAAYLVQSDCGDFSEEDYPDNTYLSHSRFIPQQTAEFQQKVMDNHRNLVGMSPGESDLAMLEVARRCDFYGIKFHAAKDIEGTDANLAVMHLGIKVFHQLHCVSTFSWAKIRKLSFKRKKLLIKLHPDSYQYYKETIEFVFETRNECKNFWKKCVEHHAFFRCTAVDGLKKDHKLFSKGSSFRYHGRTQRQLIDYVREHHKRREPFTRPLRSAVSTRPGPYATATYAVVSDRKKNGRTHASMPHLPHQPNAIDSDYDSRQRKRSFVYGVNSTFSSECIMDPLPPHKRNGLSTSLTSNIESMRSLPLAESSDSGGVSLYPDSKTSRTSKFKSVEDVVAMPSTSMLSSRSFALDHMEHQLEPESSSEQSEPYLEREDSLVGGRKNSGFTMENQQNIIKELLNHERSAARDLSIVSKKLYPRLLPFMDNCRVLIELFHQFTDLHTSQLQFLKDLEEAVKISRPIDIASFSSQLLCTAHNLIPIYTHLIQQYPIYLSALDELTKSKVPFRMELAKLESQDEFYLPVNWILLKIINRISGWQPILARLVELFLSEGRTESEMTSSRVALEKISQFAEWSKPQRNALAEYVALLQLETDIGAPSLLTQPTRKLLRLGWVERWSQRGLQPRVLLLFSDRILFAHRTNSVEGASFAIHAELKLKGMLIEEGDTYNVVGQREDAITLHSGDKSIVFATPARDLWMEDLGNAIKQAARNKLELPPIKLDRKDENEITESMSRSKSLDQEPVKSRLSPLQVCWHRRTCIGISDIHAIVSNTQSGYILRKLRNSSGWQKLWVALVSHTLFFYKTHEDENPLANLPLIDYGIGMPSLDDRIHHENCFKLFYGSHQYFFRTDSQYAFYRWIDTIRKAAISKQPLDVLTSLSLRI